MNEKTVQLVYEGGLSLSFRAGGVKHRVARGVPFAVAEATAAILLEDPAVSRFVAEQSTAAQAIDVDGVDLDELSVTELKVLATNLGLHPKARATRAELAAEIRTRAAVEFAKVPQAEIEPTIPVEGEFEDEASASDPTPRPGTITLADIPAGGIKR